MPGVIDAIEPHRQAVHFFGAVIYKDGAAVPTVNTGLLTSSVKFFEQTGIQLAADVHVVSIEPDLLGAKPALDAKLWVDGVAYRYRGPVDGKDIAVTHLQVVRDVP